MTAPGNSHSELVLILAPQGRDAALARQLLTDAGLPALTLADVAALRPALAETAGAVLVTEDAIRTADLAPVNQWLAEQPAWSDMPFIILTRQGGGPERNPAAARFSGALGNVTFLERPFHPTTLISVIQTALRGRRRQYEARGRLEALRSSEERLRDLNATLEQRIARAVDERTMAEEALRQSQKMEAVGQLTGGLAHDFNNLLTGITGSLELMQTRIGQGRAAEVHRYVAAAQDAAKRAAALTHRLLAFSRRQTLAPKPTNVNALVDGMADLVQRTVGPEITVEAMLTKDLWPTLVDGSQLENALLNLCINARDAMPDGGKITIETSNHRLDDRAAHERELEAGQYVCLCVSDTGTGMPPHVIAKAFEPFFTTKPLGQGTGLGLSMIYGFTKQSGGQVSIYSEVGQGTTIRLYLPPHMEAEEHVDLSPELTGVSRAQEGETVLVVDDEPALRMLVGEVLEDLGYTVMEAPDGVAGLKILQSGKRIDLLVTDVGLPGGLNGRQMADAARVARPDLKVLFITGYAEQAVISHGHLDQGMHVLTKPFALDALTTRIKDMISD